MGGKVICRMRLRGRARERESEIEREIERETETESVEMNERKSLHRENCERIKTKARELSQNVK